MAREADRNRKETDQVSISSDIADLPADKKLNELLRAFRDLKLNAENQQMHIRNLAEVGIALSSERNISRLLELIVDEARAFCNADGGTLYILDEEKQNLQFTIVHTDSLNIRMGGTSGTDIAFPDVPLYIDGEPNHANVSSHVALNDQIVNIPDVYEAEGFDFTGARNYDESSGYRSRSMLVIPMKNHVNEPIGVLQLLNAQDPKTGDVLSFSTADISPGSST